MPPKSNSASTASASDAPAMNHDAIRQLVVDSVTAALEAQAANMENADNTKRNLKPREAPIARNESVFSCSNYTEDCKDKRSYILMTYKLELPEELSNVHSTFHISNLKKCLSEESLVILVKELRLNDKLNFVEELAEVTDREFKQQKQSRIPIVKVRWNSKRGPEFTWERKDQICAKYPHLFLNITLASN
uniref:Putative reverse transcriptase domain-containing protein n=1 Tax=Tanacetum cinerariifolium TaxID=118510 RepID=A0A6L2NKG4_TANCI|nr:putative reverse transcriptase domain-containing protein [Tanacetum cinerariifolium]